MPHPQTPSSATNSPTQPFSLSGPHYYYGRKSLDYDAGSIHNVNVNAGTNENDETPTYPPVEEQAIDSSEINISYAGNTVTWNDVEGREQHAVGIALAIYSSTSTNTALLRLYCEICLRFKKRKTSNKQTIFLFIYPESIKYILFGRSKLKPGCQSLCFTVTTQPSLIIPKNCILQSKQRTDELLRSMQALAGVTEFTIHFDSNTPASTQTYLKQVASLFSPDNDHIRPHTAQRCANLDSLYNGKGGEVASITAAATIQAVSENLPPSYNELSDSRASNKRKRGASDDNNGRSPKVPDRTLLFLERISTSIGCIEGWLAKIEGQLGQIEGRLDKIEVRHDQIEVRLDRLESNISDSLERGHSPCRYGSEERREIFDDIEERADNCEINTISRCNDKMDEVDEHVRKAVEEMQEEMEKRAEQLTSTVEEDTERLVTKSLKHKLQNASLRIDGSVFLDLR